MPEVDLVSAASTMPSYYKVIMKLSNMFSVSYLENNTADSCTSFGEFDLFTFAWNRLNQSLISDTIVVVEPSLRNLFNV